MSNPTFSKNERAYIEAHKRDAEAALRALITDIHTARREIASYAMAFSSMAQFLEEVLAIEDRGKQRLTLQGVIQVCHNFSVPINNVYAGLRSIGNFDHETPVVKKAKKRPARQASKSLGALPIPT